MRVETGIGLRAVDGAELFTLSQVTVDGSLDDVVTDRNLCRIRWHEGGLARGCVSTWVERGP